METREFICINCPLGCMLTAKRDENNNITISGNTCPRGETYGKTEMTDPRRTITSTVAIQGVKDKVIPVKTQSDIPKEKIMECMEAIKNVKINLPVCIGDIVIDNVAGTGVNVVATKAYRGDA